MGRGWYRSRIPVGEVSIFGVPTSARYQHHRARACCVIGRQYILRKPSFVDSKLFKASVLLLKSHCPTNFPTRNEMQSAYNHLG